MGIYIEHMGLIQTSDPKVPIKWVKPSTSSQPRTVCAFLHETFFPPHSTLLAVQVLTATAESLISCHGYTIFSPASTGLRDVKWFPVLPLEWPVGVVVCVNMRVCILICVYGSQRRCHLVTSLLQLDHFPDDPETVGTQKYLNPLIRLKEASAIARAAPYAL